jgi:hypothetical protein
MILKSKIGMIIVVISSLMVLAGLVIYFWTKAEYHPTDAIAVAQKFLQHLERREFPEAYALTVQNNEYVGKTLATFSSNAEPCASRLFKYTFPFQSNGNRLRRWLSGKEVEMFEVGVEFECPYPYKIVLRRVFGQWKILNYGAHAG